MSVRAHFKLSEETDWEKNEKTIKYRASPSFSLGEEGIEASLMDIDFFKSLDFDSCGHTEVSTSGMLGILRNNRAVIARTTRAQILEDIRHAKNKQVDCLEYYCY